VNTGRDVSRDLEEILRQRGCQGELAPDLLLGAGGLALDSIAMAEVLLACEERFDIVMAAELLDGEPLTIARLVERVEGALVS